MSKKHSEKQQEQQQENLSFEPYTVCIEKIATCIQLLSCEEEKSVLATLIAIDKFSRKDQSCVEALLENGLDPKQLLSMAFETSFLPLDSSARRFAAKILTRLVKIPEIRESLTQGAAHCLASLQRDDGDTMNEFSSNILSELIREKSFRNAASILIYPPVNLDHPLKILFTRLSTTKDPDVIYNCLKNIWLLLLAVSALRDSGRYVYLIEQYLSMEALLPLFQCSYPSIQLLSMAVAYEGAVHVPAAASKLFSLFPQLLTQLESPENTTLHCTILALISKLLSLSAREEIQSEAEDPEDLIVDCNGPSRLLKYYSFHSLEQDDLHFWSLVSVLSLFRLPSAATFLINEHQFETKLPDLISDEDSRVAVTAAHALSCIWRQREPVKEIALTKVAKYLVALAARWPKDMAVPFHYRQTFEGCSIAARAFERLIRDYPYARAAFVYDFEEESSERKSSGDRNLPLISKQKPFQSLIYLEDVLEKVGKLPDDCISNILKVVAILAKNGKLRPMIVAAEGLVASVVDCLHAPSYSAPDVEPPYLPDQWPKTTKDLECLLLERFSTGGVWKEKNSTLQLSSPPVVFQEDACVALGFLMLEPVAEQIFLRNNGAARILHFLKRNEKGFGGISALQATLSLIAHCPPAVANTLIYDGTLRWLMSNKISGMRHRVSSAWDAAITHLLNSNPSAKFQITGRLDAEDVSGDLFYIVCPPPKSFSSFKSIHEYRDRAPKPSHRVYVACWSPLDELSSTVPRESSRLVSEARGSLEAWEADRCLISYEAELREQLLKSAGGMREKVVLIAKFVWETMSIPTETVNFDFELYMEELKISIGEGDVIPLSRVRMGNYTERAMLFKVLADRIGVPAALVRGPYGRSWIEVAVEKLPEKSKDVEEEESETPRESDDVEEEKEILEEPKDLGEDKDIAEPKDVEEERKIAEKPKDIEVERKTEITDESKDEEEEEVEIEITGNPKNVQGERKRKPRKISQTVEGVKQDVIEKKEALKSKERRISKEKENPTKKTEKKRAKDRARKSTGSRRESSATDNGSDVPRETKDVDTKQERIQQNFNNKLMETFSSEEREEFSNPASPHMPTATIRPNHVVDLMTNIGHMYPIGSKEANIYCGFQSNSYETLPRPPYCTCWKNDDEVIGKKTSEIADSEDENGGYIEDDENESAH